MTRTQTPIVIIDYGMGNLRSVLKKFENLKIPAIVSGDKKDIEKAEKLLLPGVGHFENGMKNLANLDLLDLLNEKVLISKTPILGICLGMQLFAKHSSEGNVNGLGWIDANVVRFNIKDTKRYKVPHIGWNNIEICKNSSLVTGLTNESMFYFVHSYHTECQDKQDVLCSTNYEYQFTSGVAKENIMGVQYHPEKSYEAGDILFKNFASL